jgi:transposase-like protein
MNSVPRKVIKRMRYPLEVMLICVRWCAAYPSSLRSDEELMAERGVQVDHVIIHRWAVTILPAMTSVFRRHKRPVGASWRGGETDIRVGGQWTCLYRIVDRDGATVDLLLRTHRDLAAAQHLLEQAILLHGLPDKVTIDQSGSNTSAVVEMVQSTYLNNIVEQDHRAIKRRVRPMRGFKSFQCARHSGRRQDHAHNQDRPIGYCQSPFSFSTRTVQFAGPFGLSPFRHTGRRPANTRSAADDERVCHVSADPQAPKLKIRENRGKPS